MFCFQVEFPYIVTYKIPEEVNEVLFCSRQKSQIHSEGKKKFEPTLKAFKKINQIISSQTQDRTEPLDLNQSMKQLKIVWNFWEKNKNKT